MRTSLLVFVATAALLAQTNTAELTGAKRTVHMDDRAAYRMGRLAPGEYGLTASVVLARGRRAN